MDAQFGAGRRREDLIAAGLTGPAVFSDQALKTMKQHGISPTPTNYHLWYAYYAAELPPLSRELDALLESTPRITDDLCSQIHDRYFSAANDDVIIRETNLKMQGELERLMKKLNTAESDTSRFGDTLMGYSDSLASTTDDQALRNYLSSLISETRSMEEKSRSLEGELKSSSHEIARLKRSLEAARMEALTDQLTNIGNRKLFEQSLQLALSQANATNAPLSLIFCDVDHFKKFNDTWGHKLGDHVLRLVSQQMKDHAAECGIPTRFGGEEFAIILPQTALEDATVMAERLRLAISSKTMKTRTTGVNLGRITMSYGVALYIPGESGDSFVARADRALYAAKDNGRNCVIVDDGEGPLPEMIRA